MLGIFLVLLSTVARIVALPDGIYTIELRENAGRADKYLGFDETGSSPEFPRIIVRDSLRETCPACPSLRRSFAR